MWFSAGEMCAVGRRSAGLPVPDDAGFIKGGRKPKTEDVPGD